MIFLNPWAAWLQEWNRFVWSFFWPEKPEQPDLHIVDQETAE